MIRNLPDVAADARAALDSMETARAALADQAMAPWWYHVGLGLGAGVVFASLDAGGSLVPTGVIVGGILLPTALALSVARSRGVSVNCSVSAPGTRALNGMFLIALIVLGGIGLTLKLAANVPGVLSGAGLLAMALTVYVSRRNDEALHRDLLRRI